MLYLFRFALCAILTLPSLAAAGPFGMPPLPGPFAVGGGRLAKSGAPAAATVTDPSEMFGHWRSIGVDASDPESPVTDTMEAWIGADGSMEMRIGVGGIVVSDSGERYSARLHAINRWESVAGDFIVTPDRCRIASDFEALNQDCSDQEPDTSSLSMYRVADIGGRRALIFLSDDSEFAEADDTLFYVGATAAFIVAPVLGPNSVRPLAQVKAGGSRLLARRDGGFAALLPDGRMLDPLGRALPPGRE